MSLRIRLLGTIVGAIVLFFIISVVAARLALSNDLMAQGKAEVTNGSNAFAGYWAARKEQVRLLIAQDAVADALRKDLQSHDTKALQDFLSNLARTSGLSFLTVVDTNGNVVARGNGGSGGSLAKDSYIQRALTGETVSSAVVMPQRELQGEGLELQAMSNVSQDGKTVEKVTGGLAIVATAPISDLSERTLGAIYGGVLMNHFYDLVDQSSQALGGQTGVMIGDAMVASTISMPDGTRVIDSKVNAYDANNLSGGTPWVGSDVEGGTQYLARLNPIQNDQNQVIGALWYGTPMSQITSIINHMTETFILWGFIAMIIALIVSVPVVQRLSVLLTKRSEQVSAAAKELGVAIVGGEVSGDHVAATKAAVERAGKLIGDLSSGKSGAVEELKAVNDELAGDMIVIDTLSQEMSSRLQQAVARVAELNDVASGLDILVHGTSAK